ncbi:MAG: carbohydrate ABC transporter permease [Eubacteriales bacterium]|jgi:multiple sugar transport system permease protein
MKNKSGFWNKAIRLLLLMIITYILLFPMTVALFTSLKPPGEVITATPSLLPHNFTLQNYRVLFSLREFPRYLWNSLLVSCYTALISILVSSLAAYALVWMNFTGKRTIVKAIFFTYMFPQILLVLPLFLMCYELNLIDTKMALVLTYLSFSLPFCVWMLKSFFESIPEELVEAAMLDGCTYLQCLFKVVLPVSIPAVTAVLVFSFVLGWSEYLFANTLIISDTNRTIAIGLQTLIGYYRVDYGLLTAASVVMTLPVLLFFVSVQKYFIEGLVIGSVKE